MKYYIVVLMVSLLCVQTWGQEDSLMDLFRVGRYRDVIEQSKVLLEENDKDILTYVVMGWSYLSLGQWKSALNIAKRGEKIRNHDPRIAQIIGEAYYELEQYDLALPYIAKYLSLSPKGQLRSWMYYYLGEIYRTQEKYYKAEMAYSTAVLLKDDRPTWWISLAEIHENQGEIEIAKEIYLRVLALDSSNLIAKKKIKYYNQN